MEANVRPNERPISSFFLAKIQGRGKVGIISDFEDTVPLGIVGSLPKSTNRCGAPSWSSKFQQHLNLSAFSGIQPF